MLLLNISGHQIGGNDGTVIPSFPYLLNKVSNPSLPCFHYFFPMFDYCTCLKSVLVTLQNYSSFFVVWLLPLYRHLLSFQWIVCRYPHSKIRVMKIHYPYGTKFRGLLLFFFHFTYALDFLYFHQNSAKKGWFVVPVPMLHIHTFPGVFWYQQYLASLENCLYIFFSLHLLLNSAFFFFSWTHFFW